MSIRVPLFVVVTAAIALAEQKRGVVAGRVENLEGAPVPRMQMTLSKAGEPAARVALAWTNPFDGRFRFANVAPGTYQLQPTHQGPVTIEITAERPEVQDLLVQQRTTIHREVVDPGSLRGKVTLLGSPVDRLPAGLQIDLISLRPGEERVASTKSDESGGFSFANIAPGMYSVRLDPANRDYVGTIYGGVREVEVDGAHRTLPLKLEVQSAARVSPKAPVRGDHTLRCRIQGLRGIGLRLVLVHPGGDLYRWEGLARSLRKIVQPSREGAEFTGLTAGEYHVFAVRGDPFQINLDHDGPLPQLAHQTVTVPSTTDVTIELREPLIVNATLKVFDVEGKPQSATKLSVQWDRFRLGLVDTHGWAAFPVPPGLFVWKSVPRGKLWLDVEDGTKARYEVVSIQVNVKESPDTRTVDLADAKGFLAHIEITLQATADPGSTGGF